jgi:hypothetical protein
MHLREGEGRMTHPNEESDFFDAGICWHFPGRSRFTGDHQGAGQVADLFRPMAGLSGGMHRVELHDVYALDEFWSWRAAD